MMDGRDWLSTGVQQQSNGKATAKQHLHLYNNKFNNLRPIAFPLLSHRQYQQESNTNNSYFAFPLYSGCIPIDYRY